MNLEDRIAAFEKLANYISAIDEVEFEEIALSAKNENPWFTKESVQESFRGLAKLLDGTNLRKWVSPYEFKKENPKTVAIVMAGNIPLVGFHDFISVLISGHRVQIKPSSKDTFLVRLL